MSLVRRLLYGVVLPLLMLVAMWRVGGRTVALQIATGDPSPAGLERAANWDDQNPDFPFMLARYYRDLPGDFNLDLARRNARRATELSPYSWKAWWQRAQLEEVAGRTSQAEQALRHAHALDPRDATIDWRLANFYLRQSDFDAARPYLASALEGDSSLQRPAIDLLAKLGVDLSTIQAVWPEEPAGRMTLIDGVLRDAKLFDPSALHGFLLQQWHEAMASDTALDAQQAFPLIRYLLDARFTGDARQVWIEAAARNGLEDRDYANRDNQVWNGRFELPLSNAPLGWRISKGAGYAISVAPHEGALHSRGLRIEFDGTTNVNFAGLRQTIVVRPGTTYDLAFQTLSDALTTDRGIFLEVVDARTHQSLLTTEPVLGTTPWTRRMESLAIPADSDLIEIRLRRQRSLQIDNRIKGIFEFDDVALISVQP